MQKNEFDSEIKYKLYRSVKEILHPTISKKNISDYKIIISEDILPVRVFYPKKVTDINKVIVYIHGNGEITECLGKYSDISKTITKKTDTLVIAIEYEELKNNYKKMYKDIYNTTKFIYHGLEINDISSDNIILMGDSTGCNIITGINYLNNNEINISKEVLFYPVLNTDYNDSIIKNKDFNPNLIDNINKYYKYIGIDKNDILLNPLKQELNTTPKTLLFIGNVDSLKDESKDYYDLIGKDNIYVELPFSSHGFLKRIDKDIEKEVFTVLKKFI